MLFSGLAPSKLKKNSNKNKGRLCVYIRIVWYHFQNGLWRGGGAYKAPPYGFLGPENRPWTWGFIWIIHPSMQLMSLNKYSILEIALLVKNITKLKDFTCFLFNSGYFSSVPSWIFWTRLELSSLIKLLLGFDLTFFWYRHG